MNQVEQSLGITCENAQRISIQNQRGRAGKGGFDLGAGGGIHTCGRADEEAFEARVGEGGGQVGGGVHLPQHDGGEVRGVDGKGCCRGGYRDQPCPGLQRAAGGQTGGTGVVGAAGDDEGVAVGVFMGGKARIGQVPQGRAVLVALGGDGGENFRRNADLGEFRFPAQRSPRQQPMAGFAAEEGDGEARAQGRAPDLPRGTIQP